MKKESKIIPIVIIAVLLYGATLTGMFLTKQDTPTEQDSLGSVTNCDITTTKVEIGTQSSNLIVSAGIRPWVIVQQPEAATNTVSLNFGQDAVNGSGFLLDDPGVGESFIDKFVYGYSTDLPMSEALYAIGDTGSSTLNIIECR